MTLAFVFVNCAPEQSAFVEGAVKGVKGVLEAYTTFGVYDVIVKAQADDETKLKEVVRAIKSVSGVTSTVTSIVYSAGSLTSDLPSSSAFTT